LFGVVLGWIGESGRGEWRTGPALNPLKGSSVRLPHAQEECNLYAIPNFFVFNRVELHFQVKKLYLPGKFTCPQAPVAPFFLIFMLAANTSY
jgi:hypothetical protein